MKKRVAPMIAIEQGELFTPDADVASDAPATLFAEVVFDRPLDTSYSYGVPKRLLKSIEVGKRVMVPFGRGDTPTIGYCVGLSDEAPERKVKAIGHVLDDQALVTSALLKLTRWMAD